MVDRNDVAAAEVKVLDAVITALDIVKAAACDLREAKQAAAKAASSLVPPTPAPAAPKPKFDFSQHDPAWKHGPRLTTVGRMAVKEAFASGLSQAEVSRVFKIGANSAQVYEQRFRGKKPWPYGKEPGGSEN